MKALLFKFEDGSYQAVLADKTTYLSEEGQDQEAFKAMVLEKAEEDLLVDEIDFSKENTFETLSAAPVSQVINLKKTLSGPSLALVERVIEAKKEASAKKALASKSKKKATTRQSAKKTTAKKAVAPKEDKATRVAAMLEEADNLLEENRGKWANFKDNKTGDMLQGQIRGVLKDKAKVSWMYRLVLADGSTRHVRHTSEGFKINAKLTAQKEREAKKAAKEAEKAQKAADKAAKEAAEKSAKAAKDIQEAKQKAAEAMAQAKALQQEARKKAQAAKKEEQNLKKQQRLVKLKAKLDRYAQAAEKAKSRHDSANQEYEKLKAELEAAKAAKAIEEANKNKEYEKLKAELEE